MVSRYGDAERSIALLHDLAQAIPISPTSFGLSVHNAIAAQYSIARVDRSNYISLAAGTAGAAAAVVEASGLLHDGADQVLVVCYDAPLPGDYAAFSDRNSCSYAWAWQISLPARKKGLHFTLSAEKAVNTCETPDLEHLPFDLDVMRFVLSKDASLRRSTQGCNWTWHRHV